MPARRWLAGLLGLAYLFDLVLHLVRHDGAVVFAPVPLLGFVLLALARPVLGVVGGSAWLVAVSVLIRLSSQAVYSDFGVQNLMLSESVAVGALVAVAVWLTPRYTAVNLVVVVAVAGVMASGVRQFYPTYGVEESARGLALSLLSGAVVVLGGCVVGVAIRAHDDRGASGSLASLIRRQWPLAGALVVLILVDQTSSGGLRGLFYAPLAGLLMVATATCAVLGPTAPARYAVSAAVLTVSSTLAFPPFGLLLGWYSRFPVPTSIAAAHMALVAYLVRYADRTQAGLGVAAVVGADVLTVVTGAETGTVNWEFLLVSAFLLVVAMATGQYFRSRDRERNQTVRVAITGAQQAERMALARELHDVVAHHVTGIVVAAQAARLVGETNPQAAVDALERIEEAGTDALSAMRMLVGSMRGAPVAGAEGQATVDLANDVRMLTSKFPGPKIELSVDLPPSLPPEAGRTVLRIVQEALTNVGKHARAAETVKIDIGVAGDELRLRVADDAPAAEVRPAGGSGGYGLVGMRERIDLLGGRFTAGPGVGSGWVVDAGFPLRERRDQ